MTSNDPYSDFKDTPLSDVEYQETVQVIDSYNGLLCDLSNGLISNDFEWAELSRSRHSSTSSNSETVQDRPILKAE